MQTLDKTQAKICSIELPPRSKKATGGKMNEKTDELEVAPLKEGLAVLELACEKIEGFEDKKSFVGSDISSGIVQTLILGRIV